jgi:phospholipase C
VTYDHVIWIWMENKNRGTVFDSSQSPFMHDLAASCASAANYVDHGIRPSLANYIAATSGDTQGVADDNAPAKHPLTVDNLFRQVRASGRSARSYQESMPGNCTLDSAGKYAVKHNPAAYYIGADDRQACQRDDVPFDQFATDLAAGTSGGFPAFSLITPNICNDMHDCSVGTGDAWLRAQVEPILSSPLYRQGHTAIFVVFDESQGSGTIPFIAIAPSIAPGTVASAQLDHFALLRFTEEALGISAHLGRAANAADLRAAVPGL